MCTPTRPASCPCVCNHSASSEPSIHSFNYQFASLFLLSTFSIMLCLIEYLIISFKYSIIIGWPNNINIIRVVFSSISIIDHPQQWKSLNINTSIWYKLVFLSWGFHTYTFSAILPSSNLPLTSFSFSFVVVHFPGKCMSHTSSTYTFTTCRILHPSDELTSLSARYASLKSPRTHCNLLGYGDVMALKTEPLPDLYR